MGLRNRIPIYNLRQCLSSEAVSMLASPQNAKIENSPSVICFFKQTAPPQKKLSSFFMNLSNQPSHNFFLMKVYSGQSSTGRRFLQTVLTIVSGERMDVWVLQMSTLFVSLNKGSPVSGNMRFNQQRQTKYLKYQKFNIVTFFEIYTNPRIFPLGSFLSIKFKKTQLEH